MAESSGGAAPAKVIFGKYELGRVLGRGASAKVYYARHIASGRSVAIKVFPKPRRPSSSGSSSSSDSFIREISALRLLRHPHIVRLHEVLASRSSVYLVLELAKGGELISRVHDRGRLPDDLSRRLFHQLLSAVAYSHSRGVFHRDLKPENLLLDDGGDLKVSDFGFSAVSSFSEDYLLHTQCGTPAYVAPEILLSSKGTTGYDGAKADIWSCGVILFVLNAGYLPFNDRNLMSLYRKIHSGHHRCPRWTPPDLRRLISRLLDPNPATRVSVDGILRDPWFARGVDPEQLATMMRPRGSDAGLDDKPHRRRGGELNAFDLISFASGLDLSGLFVDAASDRQRFASVEPVDRILDRVEEVGKGEGLVVTREVEKGSAAVIDGRNGEFVLMLQVYQLTGGTSVVEVEVGGGAIGSFWNETLRPVLSGPLHLGGLG
ncbi:CBL-interacting serine threonine-protein kinase 11 [Musa troglodytarum]|uniref:non-specific serine/threonine protein kinase n=1 Tax=Musa troglodytarum TaxID=320322 RepID=A0A9E7KMX9_9LILI|nr:CBL-interacting serine threonine-protein kinase 11 [Musa troglodytarum]